MKRRAKNKRVRRRVESAISPTAEKRIRKLIDNPPRGGDIAKAKKFGVDLYSVLENLKLTPGERLRRAGEETDLVRRIRQHARVGRS